MQVSEQPASRQRWLEIGLILLVFYFNSGWPVPDNNEAHSLGKARHYWDPSFCAGDAFFESAHTHQVFYVLLGWWTLILPLPAVAWIGRLLTWTLLAAGWQRLSWRCVPRPWWSIFSAALMIALQERCQVAGEWLVGGFEAKGIAYGLVFFALDAAFAGRWKTVWLWLGAASAWHVLVGGWSVLAMFWAWWFEHRDGKAPCIRALLAPLTLGALLAMPALIPALRLTLDAAPDVVAEANRIYVFERLGHHLNPAAFPPRGVVILVALLVVTGVLSRAAPATVATRSAWRFAAGAAAISLAGWLISLALAPWPELAAGLLKYYWFRLADVAIPVAVSLLAVAYLRHALRSAPSWGRAWLTAAGLFAAFHLVDFGIQTQTIAYPRADKPGKVVDHDAWREACEWIDKNTPPGSRFITPRQNQTFKWYAERAEAATWKDVPQDAQAIIRWSETLQRIYGTNAPYSAYSFSPPEQFSARADAWTESLNQYNWRFLQALGAKYGAEYVVTEAEPRLERTPEYVDTKGEYAVYKLTDDEPGDE